MKKVNIINNLVFGCFNEWYSSLMVKSTAL